MKKLLLIVGIAFVAVGNVKAQDIHFSQFFTSPLTLNPALTGKFDGQFRAAGNYRNQWPTIYDAFVTKSASIDFGVMKNRIPEIDQMGVGVLGFTDRAGDGVLVTNSAGLSLAYHKGLDEDGFHSIGVGFQGSYTNKRLDVSRVTFADQLTPLGFTGTTSEVFNNKQINVGYADINAGILYNGSTNGYNNFYIGASMYHINRPKESFQGTNFLLSPRTTLQAGAKIPLGSTYNYFHFASIYSIQAGAKDIVMGGSVEYNVNHSEDDPTNIYLGAWTRFNNVNDAIIPYIGLEFKGLRIGYSYDVNISQLNKASNMQGGNEISLIYIKKPSDPNAKKLNCPKF
ncbi:MAG: hypothetical protein RIR12_1205 [Bacteroidota bacterium]|jgi:type IX secretion system PorP/SprF family membrane protein